MSYKFRVNDEVVVISGRNKGKKGVIKKIVGNKILVDGINLVLKHQKPIPSRNILGGKIYKESFISISNVSHFCKNSNKKSKIGFKFINNKKVRYLKYNKLIF